MRVRARARARVRARVHRGAHLVRARVRGARASVHRGAHLLGCHRRGTSRATGAADGAVLELPLLEGIDHAKRLHG